MTGRTVSRIRVAVAALAALVATTAGAQTAVPAFELERLELNPGAQSSLVTNGGKVLPDGGYRVSIAAHYERDPLVVFRDDVKLGSVVSDRVTAHLIGAYGIGDRFELGIQVPIVAYQQGDDLTNYVATPASAGLGTPTAMLRFALMNEDKGDPLSIALGLGAGLPFGSEAALAHEPGFALSPRLGLSKDFGMVAVNVDGSFVFRTESTQLGTGTVGNMVGVGAGVTTTGEGFRAELDGRGLIALDGSSPDVEVLAGVRYPVLEQLELYALGGPGIGSMPGSPVFRVVVGAAYGNSYNKKKAAPPPPPPPVDVCAAGQPQPVDKCPELDKDHDGVKNALDACPEKPEDLDNFEDRDGCPDPDNDQDGILDAADKCPNEKGEEKYQGCPPPDQDKDGVLDADDQCPTVPGTVEKKGCPFLDEDKDGIEDQVDACPKEAGPVENRGCPIKDTDGDTVPDHLDNCPNEKGDPANQGCPKKVKQLVVITREKIVIKDKVYFATGKAKILPKSFNLLNQVGSVINDHPQIPHITVEGHTDNTGSAETNRKLSQARADSVRDYLVTKGKVDPARLQAIGYGPDRPAADNATAKGREANRRVEFTIQDANQPQSESFEVEPLVPGKGSGETPAPATDGGTPAPAPSGPTTGASSATDAGTPPNVPAPDAGAAH